MLVPCLLQLGIFDSSMMVSASDRATPTHFPATGTVMMGALVTLLLYCTSAVKGISAFCYRITVFTFTVVQDGTYTVISLSELKVLLIYLPNAKV